MINESLNWEDHVDYITSKVKKRLGVLKRIKCLLPASARKRLATTTILPLLDYADIMWGDKNNKTFMDEIQILQTKMAKIILDKPVHASATEDLNELESETIFKRRKLHRLHFMYKVVNDVFDWDFHIPQQQKVHDYDTGKKSDLKIPISREKWGSIDSHIMVLWNGILFQRTLETLRTSKQF